MMQELDDFRDEVDGHLFLQPLLRTLWLYRRTMQLAFAVAVICASLQPFLPTRGHRGSELRASGSN